MTNKDTEIRLHLYLRSKILSPEEISDELGCSFDECHRLGESRAHGTKIWEDNWWILDEKVKIDFRSAYDELKLALDRLLARVEHKREVFVQLASDDQAELSVVIESDGYPGMGLDSTLVKRLAQLGVSLDFDLYCEPHTQSDSE
jgi:Domain of unknown function (DUF4279)